MAEQALDLRSTVAVLRRRRGVLAAAAALGIAAGVAMTMVFPPMYTSTSEVLLPPAQDANGQPVIRDMKTEVSIAESDLVLGAAAEQIEPRVSLRQLRRRVDVVATSSDVLQFTARADVSEAARTIAQEMAEAEVAYVKEATSSLTNAEQEALAERGAAIQRSLDTIAREIEETTDRLETEDPDSLEGQADATALAELTAQQGSLVLQLDEVRNQVASSSLGSPASLIQKATVGRRPATVTQFGLSAIRWLVGALLTTVIVLLVLARRDRRLRYRDEIADALGSPVIGSVRSRVPRSVAGWVALLADYKPGTVDAWALRQCLRQLAPLDKGSGTRPDDPHEPRVPHPRCITVIALADDARGLAVGPQLASYAASAGVATTLVMVQGHESAAPLWAAAAQLADSNEARPGLRVVTAESVELAASALTVLLVVVDRRRPVLPDLPEASHTIISLAAGAATAEELARVAVTADDAGSRIVALVVADPDNLDRTTGRLLQRERAQQVPLPARMTGGPGSNVSRLRRRQP